MVSLRCQYVQGFLAVLGKAEGELTIPDLTTKPLPDQSLEIGLVINAEDFDRVDQGIGAFKPVPTEAGASAVSADRNPPASR